MDSLIQDKDFPLPTCPFCGSEAIWVEEECVGGTGYQVRCNNVECWIGPYTSFYTEKATAIEAWETRAKTQQNCNFNSREMVCLILQSIFCCLVSCMLGISGVAASDWRFWVIFGSGLGLSVCGFVLGKESQKTTIPQEEDVKESLNNKTRR